MAPTPEQRARERIDAMLIASGWAVQDKKALNPSASLGVAVREYDTDTGPADYILFVDRVPVGVVEAKAAHEGERITVHEDQAETTSYRSCCKENTYSTEEDPQGLPARFRNDYDPRIAVAVGMIATTTNLKPRECLLFMRDVKSRNYFEQIVPRTRTLDADSLKKVSPSATTNKTHFLLVDAVGVTKNCKTDSRPLERRKVWACPGSNPAGSGFPLQVRARITGLAGFPLQSVTRNAGSACIF